MQLGFVSETFIAEATRFLQMLQKYLDEEDEEGVLIFLDMEKAFDRVGWRYLKEAMHHLGYTEKYMSWINILYPDGPQKPKRKTGGELFGRDFPPWAIAHSFP